MKTVGFVPIKLNSERLPFKNIKAFRNGEPLICYILNTLKKVNGIDEIYVYCSSEEIKNYLPKGVQYLKRDPYYDLSTTKFNEVLASFTELICADIYVLAHATAPFLTVQTIEDGIRKVRGEGYDSAFTVCMLQEFLWKNGRPLNYDLDHIPRTQDLEQLYMETCGMYIYRRELMKEQGRRIGDSPYFMQISKIEACDINTEEDFYLANAIYNYGRK